MAELSTSTLIVILGAVVGVLFGAVAQRSRFCFRAATVELLERRPLAQATAWLAAMLAAIGGTQTLAALGIVDLGAAGPLAMVFSPLALIVGGLLFGVGMMLAGGCTGRLLVLSATGNLRALVVLVIGGITAYATMRGLLAPVRMSLAQASAMAPATPSLVDGARVQVVIAAAALAGLVLLMLRRASATTVTGALIGALIPTAWAITGYVGADEFEPTPLAAISFTGPVAEALQYVMTFTGSRLDFPVALVIGVFSGSFAMAAVTGELRLVGFEGAPQMRRYLAGAVLMGTGAVLAGGCTIGQGLSGLSTLSLGALLVLPSIAAGGVVGRRLLRSTRVQNEIPALLSAATPHAS